jgi:hypothetical protein
LAKNAGFDKIGEKVVHHQARKYGTSKFMGLNRFVNGYLDLLTLWFLSTFGKKPMHVFGFLGTLMFFVGFVAAFLSGCVACKWMINIVKKGKLIYFGIYCAIVGVITIITQLV